jgi:hypothetical protein
LIQICHQLGGKLATWLDIDVWRNRSSEKAPQWQAHL